MVAVALPWRAHAARLIDRARRAALDVVFPPTCLACRAPVAQAGALCGACWRAMRFIERPFCDRLGTPFEVDLGEGAVSQRALSHPPAFQRARAVALFEDGPSRKLIHRLKYSDRLDLARPMGAWMARAGRDILADADVLMPAPLHRARLWRRQYNQAAALAREVARLSGVEVDFAALARIRPTRSQVGLSRVERARNVAGAFRCARNLDGRRIVLIDDVLTSGATADAASRALLEAGAGAVDVLVFARVAA